MLQWWRSGSARRGRATTRVVVGSFAVAAAGLMAGRASAATPPQVAGPAVLVLAHGGSDEWNAFIEDAVRASQLTCLTRVVFGMGMHAQEGAAFQRAVDDLRALGASRLIVVPLLVSSHSEVMRQFEYLFGLRQAGPWAEHVHPLQIDAPVTMAAALDDDPFVAEILLERARALSRHPARETVLLVAHGPTGDAENVKTLEVMARLADAVRSAGRFHAVIPVTMRDDAEATVRDAATQRLRALITQHAVTTDVLVVPLLLARGGVEGKIPQRLAGLQFRFSGEVLLPHPNISAWIHQRVSAHLGRSGVGEGAVLE